MSWHFAIFCWAFQIVRFLIVFYGWPNSKLNVKLQNEHWYTAASRQQNGIFYPKWLLIERKFRCFTNCNATHHFNDADNSHTRLKNTTHRALVEKTFSKLEQMWNLNFHQKASPEKIFKFMAWEREKMLMEKAFPEYFSPFSITFTYFTIQSTSSATTRWLHKFSPSFFFMFFV